MSKKKKRVVTEARDLRLDGDGPFPTTRYGNDPLQLVEPLLGGDVTCGRHNSGASPTGGGRLDGMMVEKEGQYCGPHPNHDSMNTCTTSLVHRRPCDSTMNTHNCRRSSSSASFSSRILDRDAPFHQSRGRWNVRHLSRDVARRHHISSPPSASGSTTTTLRTTNNNIQTRQHRRRRQQQQPGALASWTKHVWNHWFYTLAYQRTGVMMAILFLTYTGIVFAFGFVYLGVSKLGQQTRTNSDGTISKLPFCDMDINDHMEALYFSLSTMTSIGYGVSDYYFGGCWTPLILVLCQACTAITFDAVAIGLLFQRISRGHKRGKTIIFSDTAVIQRVNGILYLMIRMGEMRRHQLRDASVRGYCIRHERHAIRPPPPPPLRIEQHEQPQQQQHPQSTQQPPWNPPANDDEEQGRSWQPQQQCSTTTTTTATAMIETTHYVTRSMKFLHEQDGSGSAVLMSLPQVIVHRLDEQSPLYPPTTWYDGAGVLHQRTTAAANATAVVREEHTFSDTKDGAGNGGVLLTTDEQLQLFSHDNNNNNNNNSFKTAERRGMEAFWEDRQAEIVLLVEGTDELTGAIIQSRHSYTLEDLAWDHAFVPCVFPTMTTTTTTITANHNPTITQEENHNHSSSGCQWCCCGWWRWSSCRCCCRICRRCKRRWRRNHRENDDDENDDDLRPLHQPQDGEEEEEGRRGVPSCYVDFAAFHNTRPAPDNVASSPYVY